jgi:hypothetical protein
MGDERRSMGHGIGTVENSNGSVSFGVRIVQDSSRKTAGQARNCSQRFRMRREYPSKPGGSKMMQTIRQRVRELEQVRDRLKYHDDTIDVDKLLSETIKFLKAIGETQVGAVYDLKAELEQTRDQCQLKTIAVERLENELDKVAHR